MRLIDKRFSIGYFFILFGFLMSFSSPATDFSTQIQCLSVTSKQGLYRLNAIVYYSLSPTSKEALQKGIPLTWILQIKVKQMGWFWDIQLKKISLAYQIQYHPLLHLYSVKKLTNGSHTLYATLTAALKSISKIAQLPIIEQEALSSHQNNYLAIKVFFNRESLPIPLRPFAYFDSQWALSSPWIQCPITP